MLFLACTVQEKLAPDNLTGVEHSNPRQLGQGKRQGDAPMTQATKAPKLTRKAAQLILRDAGMTLRPTGFGAEMKVARAGFPGGDPAAYFTDDLQDALDTGLHMARTLPRVAA